MYLYLFFDFSALTVLITFKDTLYMCKFNTINDVWLADLYVSKTQITSTTVMVD